MAFFEEIDEPILGEVLTALEGEGAAVWIEGAELAFRLPANKPTLRYQIMGVRGELYQYLLEQREERAGILMDSGMGYERATAVAQNQIKQAALRAANPEWDRAALILESQGSAIATIKSPSGELIWN